MSSAEATDAAAAMPVDSRAEEAGALLVPEEEFDDDVIANLMSPSWLKTAIVYDKYGLYPWTPLWASLVKQRFSPGDSCRMVSIWTTNQGMYGPLYAVPQGTVKEFLILRCREHWWIFAMLRHLTVHELPPEVGDKPHISCEYYGDSPSIGGG